MGGPVAALFLFAHVTQTAHNGLNGLGMEKPMRMYLMAAVAAGILLGASQVRADAIAMVNGSELPRKDFDEQMMKAVGARVFRAMVDWKLVEQDCAEQGIKTSGEEFEKAVEKEIMLA